MKTLDEIARHHGTDKSTEEHGYTTIYESHLSQRRNQSLTVLEIGVLRGASLRMWRDYFPKAQVVGIDRNQEALNSAEDHIDICIGDQSDAKFLKSVASSKGPFDLIVDDGAHRYVAQINSLNCLWPHLNPGGIYAVEDIHTSYWKGYGMGWRTPETTVEFLKYLVDDVNERTHGNPVSLSNLHSMHFYYKLCILHRR